MQNANILVVEDEKDVKDLMVLHLLREGHSAMAVENGEAALRLFKENKFDLAILDWMLPGLSGLELCKSLGGKVPVLMVTARADTSDIVLGLEMGADDYITKPFEIPVFVARVRALLRRSELKASAVSNDIVQVGNLRVNFESHETIVGDEKVHLTTSEFKLLGALLQNRGKVLSREKLIELVQGEGVVVVDRAIDTHVFGLRKKLGESSDLVETVRGVGYRVHS